MEIFLARQAIYNRRKEVVAYELLYRNSPINKYDETIAPEDATFNMIKNILSMGLGNITNCKTALINFEENLLLSDIAMLLPNKDIIIEILETVRPSNEIIKRLEIFKKRGYTLALDDVLSFQHAKPFLKYIDYIKIDFSLTSKEERINLINEINKNNIKLLAEKIETEEEFLEAMETGYDYFQGYYFSRPSMLQGTDIILRSTTVFNVLSELSKDDFELNDVEKLIKSDVVLTYKLLSFINSAHYGFKSEISSIRQAIMLIGKEQLKKWLSIITFLEVNNTNNSEYTNTSIIRARFCESIAEKIKPEKCSEAFIVGIFSEIHLVIDGEYTEIIRTLPINDEIKMALLGENNFYKQILDLVISYEAINVEEIIKLTNRLGIKADVLQELYFGAIQWAKNIC